MIPTIEWKGPHIRLLDQRRIPHEVRWVRCRSYRDVIRAIERMMIRGAPAVGIAGGMGLALGAQGINRRSFESFKKRFDDMALKMAKARPTAVNLQWAIDRMTSLVDGMSGHSIEEIKAALRREAEKILEEDVETNRRIGENGQRLIPDKATLLTHCNTGSLATGGYGTALGVIRAAHEAGKKIKVIADETRPWLQGLRLTAFELMQEGIPVTVIADSAAGSLMQRKRIHGVITGADRIAANGDVVNKIGTYQTAVLARENHIPFYVAAPLSTIDPDTETGDMIPVEERDPREISHFGRRRIGPAGVGILNPAFDMTPNHYVTAIITEEGIIQAPYRRGILRMIQKKQQVRVVLKKG